jgi:O-antigen/teichoic acid export membrane protein
MLLIPFIGANGAVVASITAEVLLAVILIVKARRAIKVGLFLTRSVRYAIAGAVMCVVMIILSNALTLDIFYKLVIEFCVGVATYGIMCIVLGDPFVIEQVKNIFGMVKRFVKRG